jgi:penicillin-binding protein 2
MSSQTVSKYEVPLWRVWIVYALLIAIVLTITSRLFTRQVLEYKIWQDQAVENYTTEISDPAARGIIYDRNGYVLARNVASYNVVITPAALPDDEADIQRIAKSLN